MAGACMACGYKQPLTEGKAKKAPQMELEARKNRTVGYYLKFSIFASAATMAKDFHNFETRTPEQKRLLFYGQGIANQIGQKKVVHGLLKGNAGVGKSHIANGILIRIQKDSDYRMTTMFVDWQLLLSQYKSGMSDGQADVKAKVAATLDQMAKADVVVIDDLGSERDTDFNSDLANEIFRQREDKNTIITTNLGGQELRKRYGDRVISRMSAHGEGNSIAIKGINDQRKQVN